MSFCKIYRHFYLRFNRKVLPLHAKIDNCHIEQGIVNRQIVNYKDESTDKTHRV